MSSPSSVAPVESPVRQPPAPAPRLPWWRVVGNLVYLVALAVWSGAAVGLTFLTTPVIFAALDRDAASRLVGLLFPGYFRLGLVCVALALVAATLAARQVAGPAYRRWAVPLLLALMLGLMGYAGLVLEPQIAAVQARIPSFLTDTDSPARQEFRRLHSLSSILNVIVLALAASCWLLTALDPRLLTGQPARRPADTPGD
jgi:hypothetical protein